MKSTTEISNELAEFLLKYRHHVEYSDRALALGILERALHKLQEQELELTVCKTTIDKNAVEISRLSSTLEEQSKNLKTTIQELQHDTDYVLEGILNAYNIKKDPLVRDSIRMLKNKFCQHLE